MIAEPVPCGELHLNAATDTVVTGWVVLGDDTEAVSLRVQLTAGAPFAEAVSVRAQVNADASRLLTRLARGRHRLTLEPIGGVDD